MGLISSVLLGVTMSSYLQFFAAALDQPVAADDFNSAVFGQVGQTLLATFVAMLGCARRTGLLALTVQADADSRGQNVTIGASVKAALGRSGHTSASPCSPLADRGRADRRLLRLHPDRPPLWRRHCRAGLVSDANEIVAVGAVIIGMFVFSSSACWRCCPSSTSRGRWIVAPVLIYTERCGPVSALSRSWALTDGSFWRMTGLLLLLVILNSVVLALPVNLIQFAMLVLVTPQMFGLVNGLLTG